MSARLTTAIRICDAAKAILRKTRRFPDEDLGNPPDWEEREHMGVEPMLLALSMELALKAWFVFDHNNPEFPKSHNLIRLFDALSTESRQKLDVEFRRTVAPFHPDIFFVDYGIRNVLYQHQDAFTDWRYMHEGGKSISFQRGTFEATLEMMFREFDKRYTVVPAMTF